MAQQWEYCELKWQVSARYESARPPVIFYRDPSRPWSPPETGLELLATRLDGRGTVLFRHALKNALLPVVMFLGPGLAGIITGSLVVEKIFAIPGIGSHFVNAALNRDYTLVMGTVLLYSALLILFNLAVDIAYCFLDPRVKVH